MCPASSGRLDRRPRTPCSGGAVDPQKNVSVGLNRRLEVRTRYVNDRPVPARAYLTPQILHLPDVPLVLDVDGERAARAGTPPYYTAPPITNDKSEDIYENGAFWFPSSRHRGRLNVGFVGGHVLSSARPTNEPWWRWDYQPEI
jgi:prepilin-type processing-associated H-X9-DG protein